METTEMMEMMEMLECCICMDNLASLQCLHCSYVFCESCCQKLAIHNHIGRCIHCKSQRPWIKSVDPNAVLSENITKIIALLEIENPIANAADDDNPIANAAEDGNPMAEEVNTRNMREGCKNIIEIFVGIVVTILVGLIVAIITGVYDHIVETYGVIAVLIFLCYGFMTIGTICFICFFTAAIVPVFDPYANAIDADVVE